MDRRLKVPKVNYTWKKIEKMLQTKKKSYGGGGGTFSGPLPASTYSQWSIIIGEIVPRIGISNLENQVLALNRSSTMIKLS